MILALAGLVVLSGCWVYSVEPLYDEHLSKPDPDLIFDQTLLGSWGRVDDDCLWILTISADPPLKATAGADKHQTPAEGSAYELTMAPSPDCKTDEKPTKYVGRLVKLDHSRFFDVSPQHDQICDLCLPLHSFFLVSQESDGLVLIPMDDDWLSKAMKEKKVELAHLSTQSIVLTASSKELKDFVHRYAEDKAVFKADSDLTLKFKRR